MSRVKLLLAAVLRAHRRRGRVLRCRVAQRRPGGHARLPPTSIRPRAAGRSGAVQPGGTLPGNPAIQLVKVADGLADPINVAAPNDGSGRLFVIERLGRIRIVDKDGNLLPDPFLDLMHAGPE